MSRNAHGAVPCRVTAVVPVKRLASAKSRLRVPAEQRQALVLAFAMDTISALSGSPLVADVVVVTSDPLVARRVRSLGARVVPDQGTGLTEALAGGVRAAVATTPGTGVAVVPADLPCLRAPHVTQALAHGTGREGAFVPDRSGTGTTFVIHPPGVEVRTAYGPASAAGHRRLGLRCLNGAPAGARHDVDTLADLAEARALGLGAHTLAALDALEPAPGRRAERWRIASSWSRPRAAPSPAPPTPTPPPRAAPRAGPSAGGAGSSSTA